MATQKIISGVTTINGRKYLIICRFNVILVMIIGFITALIGAFKLPTSFGAFLFGSGLIAFLLSIEQLEIAMIGYRKIK